MANLIVLIANTNKYKITIQQSSGAMYFLLCIKQKFGMYYIVTLVYSKVGTTEAVTSVHYEKVSFKMF